MTPRQARGALKRVAEGELLREIALSYAGRLKTRQSAEITLSAEV
jgi:hypothetical protein